MNRLRITSLLLASTLALSAPLASAMPPFGAGPNGMMPGPEGMHWLRGLSLTDAQEDKAFDIMQEQVGSMHAAMKTERNARRQLDDLVMSEHFSEAAARPLIQAIVRVEGDRLLQEARTRQRLYALLTPAQRKQLKDMPRERGFPGPDRH